MLALGAEAIAFAGVVGAALLPGIGWLAFAGVYSAWVVTDQVLLMRGADTDLHYVHVAYRVAAISAFLVGFISLLLGVTASISRPR